MNASIILVDQINRLIRIKGQFSRKIMVEACSSRLRAILLTTTTTLLGVFPMAYSFGGESGFTQPLAFSMAWGLSFSTILTLFILPALLEIREDSFKVFRYFKRKFFKKSKSVENKTTDSLSEKTHDDKFNDNGKQPTPPIFH